MLAALILLICATADNVVFSDGALSEFTGGFTGSMLSSSSAQIMDGDFGQARRLSTNPRPQLELCKCLEGRWPYSEDAAFFQTAGPGMFQYNLGGVAQKFNFFGLGVPVDAEGCTDIGGNYGQPKGHHMVCVPDTSNGPCLGFGKFDLFSSFYVMACTDTETNSVHEMDEDALKAATSMEYATGIIDSLIYANFPACECSMDMATSAIAELFCGDKAALLDKKSTNEVCASSPMFMDETIFTNGDGILVNGTLTKLIEDGQSWCMIDGTKCAAQPPARKDPCTGELWMMTPNPMIGKTAAGTDSKMEWQVHFDSDERMKLLSKRQAYPVLMKFPNNPAYGPGIEFYATTFFPENAVPDRESMYDFSGVEGKDSGTRWSGYSKGWKAAIAASQKTYAQYDKPDTTPSEWNEVAKLRADKTTADATTAREEGCDANKECAEKKKMASCQKIMKSTMEADRPGCMKPECDNRPSPYFKKSGKTCEEEEGKKWFQKKCNKSEFWARKKFCQISCFKAGNGYDGDVC